MAGKIRFVPDVTGTRHFVAVDRPSRVGNLDGRLSLGAGTGISVQIRSLPRRRESSEPSFAPPHKHAAMDSRLRGNGGRFDDGRFELTDDSMTDDSVTDDSMADDSMTDDSKIVQVLTCTHFRSAESSGNGTRAPSPRADAASQPVIPHGPLLVYGALFFSFRCSVRRGISSILAACVILPSQSTSTFWI